MPEDEAQLVLQVAGFKRVERYLNTWRRDFDAARFVEIEMGVADGVLVAAQFNLRPSIGNHSSENHHINAPLAAISFKVAMTLAERGGGRITQNSIVGPCRAEGSGARTLADYPQTPMMYEALCLGFRGEFLRGVEQLTPAGHPPG